MKRRSPVITVVSGLPRSGTSLVMQMLEAGGLPLLTDGERRVDDDNPRGYFEYAPVRALRRDASWLGRARGRGIKIVAPLLGHLPAGHAYRIVWIQRDLREVLDSQRAMLERGGAAPPVGDERELRLAFEKQLKRVREALAARTPPIPILELEHSRLVSTPQQSASRLCAFVAGGLDPAAAAAVVDPALHRQRRSAWRTS